MIFQDAEDHLFMPTLLDDVAFGPLNQGCRPMRPSGGRRGDRAVEVAGLEQRSAHHMSGGQKRAAALATVLSMQVYCSAGRARHEPQPSFAPAAD